MQNPRFIAELLKRRGNIAGDRIDEALATIERDGKGQKLTDVLVRQGIADETSLAQALADAVGLSAVPEIKQEELPLEYLRTVQFDLGFARQFQLVPIAIDGENGPVTVAVSDPLNTFAIDDLRSVLGRDVDVVVSTPTEIIDAINFVQTRIGSAGELADEGGLHEADEGRAEILEEDDDAQIIKWVNSLFIEAIKDRATDIHIQPDELEVSVRYRIDGELYRVRTAPKRFLPSIVARVKVMSGLNIAEKRLPQDGRIGFKMAGKNVDIRVSTIPVGQGAGERIVMRILNKSSIMLDLTDLGLAPDRFDIMSELIRRPDGIVLVTGPTGSGKTTTLYACLNKINQPNLNILTAEDPIEYDLKGISQMQVNPKIGLTFANCLRAFLRQDPDVVLVGEIRDRETADVAIQASLTGHLVLSTIHTNDAAGAMTRLAEMGIESFHLASTLQAVLAQRLVRILCPLCKEPYQARENDLARLGLDRSRLTARLAREQTRYGRGAFGGSPAAIVANAIVTGEPATLYRAKGCHECQGTGYQGRTGIYELLLVTDAIRSHVLKNSDSVSIRRTAVEEGMDTLRDDGGRKVLEGYTTVEEVLAATQDDTG